MSSLKSYGIDPASFKVTAKIRTQWRRSCNKGCQLLEEAMTARLNEQRRRRHAAIAAPTAKQASRDSQLSAMTVSKFLLRALDASVIADINMH